MIIKTKTKQFMTFLEAFQNESNKNLIASLKKGFHTIMEAQNHNFKVGDQVKISEDGLGTHSASVPAHAGYTSEQFSWRDSIRKLEESNAIGTITKVFPNSNHVNVDFNGHTLGVDSYMLKPNYVMPGFEKNPLDKFPSIY